MKEKGTTPNGMSEAGYIQALENYVFFTNQLAKDIAAEPGDDIEKVMSIMARGDVWDAFGDRFMNLDALVPAIADTYGYTEQQVDADLNKHFGEHAMEMLMEQLFIPEGGK